MELSLFCSLCVYDLAVSNFDFNDCAAFFAFGESFIVPVCGVVQVNYCSAVTILTKNMNHRLFSSLNRVFLQEFPCVDRCLASSSRCRDCLLVPLVLVVSCDKDSWHASLGLIVRNDVAHFI